MKITREALKRIVIQEMNRLDEENLNVTDTQGDGDALEDTKDSVEAEGEISEGIENITPENLAIAFQALGQMAGNFAPSVIAAALAMPLMDAIKYLRDNEPPKPPASRDDY